MANSKLFEIISSFSTEEEERFRLFLKSPFFLHGSNSEEMLRLFSCFWEASTKLPRGMPHKSVVHSIVFPQKAYSEARLERAYTKLGQLAEQFLRIQYYNRAENERQQWLDMAGIFRSRNMAVLYEKQLLKLKKEATENMLESSTNFLFKYHIYREEHEWRCKFNDCSNDLAIPGLLENLELFFYGEHTEMLNRFLLQQKLGAFHISETIQLALPSSSIPEYLKSKSPLINIRKNILDYFSQSEPNQANFRSLLVLLKEQESALDAEVLPELYAFLRNYCSFLILTGSTVMYEPLHEIHKDNLSKGYFYHNNQISQGAFMSITRVALVINKLKWARDFVESHRHKILGEGSSEEIYKLNLAICLFEEKKFEEALLQISYSFNFPSYYFMARRLELMCYFELESDLLPYKIEAYRKYLERTGTKKASDLDWLGNNNFVNILLQLTQSSPGNAKRSARLIQRIKEKKIIAERKWLMGKAHELA